MKRYAIKSCVIDGKRYNRGDVVPNDVKDVATLNTCTRIEGAASTDEVEVKDANQSKESTGPKTDTPEKVAADEEKEEVEDIEE